jgi:hypothetical protein
MRQDFGASHVFFTCKMCFTCKGNCALQRTLHFTDEKSILALCSRWIPVPCVDFSCPTSLGVAACMLSIVHLLCNGKPSSYRCTLPTHSSHMLYAWHRPVCFLVSMGMEIHLKSIGTVDKVQQHPSAVHFLPQTIFHVNLNNKGLR